jgi:hypothetical protein
MHSFILHSLWVHTGSLWIFGNKAVFHIRILQHTLQICGKIYIILLCATTRSFISMFDEGALFQSIYSYIAKAPKLYWYNLLFNGFLCPSNSHYFKNSMYIHLQLDPRPTENNLSIYLILTRNLVLVFWYNAEWALKSNISKHIEFVLENNLQESGDQKCAFDIKKYQ